MRRVIEVLRKVRAFLPEGGSLPDDLWERRHNAILVLLYVHAVAIVAFALIRHFPLAHSVGEGIPVAVLATLAASKRFRRSWRSALGAMSLVTASAVLVHISGGMIEMHFHFFVALGVLTLYQDWHPYLIALGYVVVHHGVMGLIAPRSVYNHPAAWRHPLTWALIHGFFVISASVALIISWRLNELERARSEEFRAQLANASIRRQQALEINDNIVQGLTVAQLALDIGRPEDSRSAIDDTLAKARSIISALLGEIQNEEKLEAGDLVRAHPALVESK